MGLITGLQLIFVAFKLAKIIDWSWLVVCSPTIASTAATAAVYVYAVLRAAK
jgi:hypothetical protein